MKQLTAVLLFLLLGVLCAAGLVGCTGGEAPPEGSTAGSAEGPEAPETPEAIGGLSYTLLTGGRAYAVSGADRSLSGTVTIPATHQGLPVTEIQDHAFTDCTAMTELVLPSSVTAIGLNAFSGCDSLRYTVYENGSYLGNRENPHLALVTVTDKAAAFSVIHENTRVIGSYAFAEMNGLDRITVPQNVRQIGAYAFYQCTALERVTVTGNSALTAIGDYAFRGCGRLQGIDFPEECTLATVGWHAFRDCTALQTVVFPTSLLALGGEAFNGCTSLESVTLPDGLATIEWYTFYGCTALKTVTLPKSVKTIGWSAFHGCTALQSITFMEGGLLKTVGEQAFYGCVGLERLALPTGVTSLGAYAFYDCTALSDVTLPATLKSMDRDVFRGCTGLVSATVTTDHIAYLPKEALRTVTLTDGDAIGPRAFVNAAALESITLPNSLRSIDREAFLGCDRLMHVYTDTLELWCRINFLDATANPLHAGGSLYHQVEVTTGDVTELVTERVTALTIPGGIITLPRYSFYGCASITSVTLSKELKYIEDGAFDGCTQLGVITFAEEGALTGIATRAFAGTALVSVALPNTLKSIGERAFASSAALTELTFTEDSLLSGIGNRAFADCKQLRSFTLPKGVVTLGDNPFAGCDSLQTVAVAPENTAFTVVGNCLVSVAGKTLVTAFRDSVLPTDGSVTVIGAYAFYQMEELTSITLPAGVRKLNTAAFSGCTGLTDIRFGGTVAEWKAMPKGDGWNESTPDHTVTCTDGKLDKNGNIVTP